MAKKTASKRATKAQLSEHAERLACSRRKPVRPVPLLLDAWTDPPGFAEALRLHLQRHGENSHVLWRAITTPGDSMDPATIVSWRSGRKAPRSCGRFVYLHRIEERYGLSDGYFEQKLPHKSRATARPILKRLSASEQRRLAWHLPNDFENRPRAEQDSILSWVNDKIITGATEYRRYQAAAMKHRYGLRFRRLPRDDEDADPREACGDPELPAGRLDAPAEIYLYPDAYHLKWRPLQVLASQERTIAWFDFWLRGGDADDPRDDGRWRDGAASPR